MTLSINTKAIVLPVVISYVLGAISIFLLKEYGWLIFILIPFLLGFLPPYIFGQKHKLSKGKSFELAFASLGVACAGLLLFAIEGFMCLLMASPALIFLTALGAIFGYLVIRDRPIQPKETTLLLIFLSFSFMSFDILDKSESSIPVTTVVMIEAPIESVWQNVVTFEKLEKPTGWLFKTGVAYPTHATIEGAGVGAIRHCNFSTGPFVEPITTWDEPHLLAFDVIEQPIPMEEYNPFWEIHPPHLDGYFESVKGQFALESLGPNKTKLSGTTWYRLKILPQFYWKAWTDHIVHEIHGLVLEHIKVESEG